MKPIIIKHNNIIANQTIHPGDGIGLSDDKNMLIKAGRYFKKNTAT